MLYTILRLATLRGFAIAPAATGALGPSRMMLRFSDGHAYMAGAMLVVEVAWAIVSISPFTHRPLSDKARWIVDGITRAHLVALVAIGSSELSHAGVPVSRATGGALVLGASARLVSARMTR